MKIVLSAMILFAALAGSSANAAQLTAEQVNLKSIACQKMASLGASYELGVTFTNQANSFCSAEASEDEEVQQVGLLTSELAQVESSTYTKSVAIHDTIASLSKYSESIVW